MNQIGVEQTDKKEEIRKPIDYSKATDGTAVIADDIYLEPYADSLRKRFKRYQDKKKAIESAEKSLDYFSKSYERYGLNRVTGGIMYREWIPGAKAVFLFGEFNNWDRWSHPCKKGNFGVWELFLPDQDGKPAITHATKFKISIVTQNDEKLDRISAWARVVWQQGQSPLFDGVFWNPEPYVWKSKVPSFSDRDGLKIYEAHVGMSSAEPKISTYIEFKNTVLPHVFNLGYNAIQLMAIMEHSYYASFGYQVTNFFAISSRCGTPEELKELIDKAHEMGILVFLDLVHSHASKNVSDGINLFDGTDHCFFHSGYKGTHPLWDSRLFNYDNWEVLRFLLSNVRWFMEEYKFDGFRFDGITSMLYTHRGVSHPFVNGYGEYFDEHLVDIEAITYLTLANDVIHTANPQCITIAEDVSGHATLCRPIAEGGIGFDYRLGMGIPDKWISLIKNEKDENWNMGSIVWELINRRYKEKCIAYAESHDQALVGDKTIAFWLMDKEMYTHMSLLQPETPIISRGIALHKMIRLITMALGGEGYLNFMGNEFGHPEWIDFPREGNNWSYHYARRRWDLVEDKLLRYRHLYLFDVAMNHLEQKYHWLTSPQAYILLKHEDDKLISFERGNLFWVFNFHPTKSFEGYHFGISTPGKYRIVLDSDDTAFGGHGLITKYTDYFTQKNQVHNQYNSLQIYIPSRTALVFTLQNN